MAGTVGLRQHLDDRAADGTDRAGSDVVVRPIEPADLPQMLELVRVALGEGAIPRTEAFWRWKHEQSPFGRSPAMVAEADGRIVSLRIFLRWRWRHGQRVLAAVRPVDTATHPDWRRRGLFERLTRELVEAMQAEGVAFLFNTPNTRSGQGYQKMGWRIVGQPTIWMRPRKPLRLLRDLAQGRRPRQVEAPHPNASTAREILSSPDLEPFLKHGTPDTSRFVTDVDAAYLAWRYRDCPGLAYHAAGVFDRASGAVVAFRQTTRHGLSELRLCDLFVAHDRASKGKARELVRNLVRERDVDFVTARAVPGSSQAGVLVRSGFLPLPRTGPILAVRPLAAHPELPAIDRLSAWGASIGDLEVF